MCHVAEHREYHKSSQEAGETIDAAGQDSVLVAVVVELVVAGQGQQRSEPRTQREEYLGGCINPNLGVAQFVPLRSQVVP